MATTPNTSSAIVRLVSRHFNSSVDEVSVTRLAGDASTRSYFRAQVSAASVIVAVYSQPFDENDLAVNRLINAEAGNPAARLTFANDPCAHIEVTNLFLGSGLPVPPVLAVSGPDGSMLIKDLGDIRLQDWLEGRSRVEVIEAYQKALEIAIRIQETTGQALEADSICTHLAFDEAKLRWELGFFFANYFNRYLHMRLDPATSNAVQSDFTTLCSALAARPRVLTHRDFHARNLMIHDGEMFIIDHQDSRMGPSSYDVASLLRDPYTTLDDDIFAYLVEWFIEKKDASSLPISDVGEFRTELELMTIQRMLKAIGTYASQAAANNPVYVPFIRPAIQRALTAMENVGRYEATHTLLKASLVDAPAEGS